MSVRSFEQILAEDYPELKEEKWGSFLQNWARALEAYETPREFIDGTVVEPVELEIKGKTYQFNHVFSPNNEQRRELMSQQKPYVPIKSPGEYSLDEAGALPLHVDSPLNNCFLCENVLQALDAGDDAEVPNNLVAGLDASEEYVPGLVLPNRYPALPGHSLHLEASHDLSARTTLREKRIVPYREVKGGPLVYKPHEENDATRGAILTQQALSNLAEACQLLNLIGLRNHVLDGMSIPGHDHFHVFPEDLRAWEHGKRLTEDMVVSEFGDPFYRPVDTPFDTMVIPEMTSNADNDNLFVAGELLGYLEREAQVFTLFYVADNLMVSPRWNEGVNSNIQVGGGVPVHYLDRKGEEFLEEKLKHTPLKGEYNWGAYLPE